MINTELCICLKNKKAIIQCVNRRIENSEYCGIHKKSNIKHRYDDFLNSTNITTKIVKIIKCNKNIDNDTKEYYTYSDFRSEDNYTKFRLVLLKKTMDLYRLKYTTKCTKKYLYNYLQYFFVILHDAEKHKSRIITIQNWFRSLLLLKRIYCNNEVDFYTNESKFEVTLGDIYIIKDISDKYYWFNVDTFGNLLEKSESTIKNPYSSNEISTYYINKFKVKYKKLVFNINTNNMSEKQKFRNKMLIIFQKFNMLDNYTDFKWFEDLNIIQLKKLYAICEDIWNYRAQLTFEKKKKVVANGIVFTILPHIIHKSLNKRYIQNILLDNFDRLCSEGETMDDKKLGTMLVLTGLVEVSFDASNAMPQYIQSANIY
jgi:hypothetical protein